VATCFIDFFYSELIKHRQCYINERKPLGKADMGAQETPGGE